MIIKEVETREDLPLPFLSLVSTQGGSRGCPRDPRGGSRGDGASVLERLGVGMQFLDDGRIVWGGWNHHLSPAFF